MENMKKQNAERHFRPLSELNLIDNFLFQTVVSQKEDGETFCRILLSTILGRQIRKVRVVAQQSVLGLDTDKHGIRMDAYVEDISEEEKVPGCEMADAEIVPDIYDIEPNNDYERESLPKRMRYYHGLIDTKHLNSGVDYDQLPKVVIIVILPYDPLGKKRMVYTIKNQCVEEPAVEYEDGALKVFLYTKGTEGNPSQELRDMLKYIQNTKEENITNEDIYTIHELVEKAKHRKEVGINYMKIWEEKRLLRKEAFAEGREEGVVLGREEGLVLGREEGLILGRAEGHAEGRAEGRAEGHAEAVKEGIIAFIEACQEFHVSKEDIINKLVEKYHIFEAEAKDYVEEVWK